MELQSKLADPAEAPSALGGSRQWQPSARGLGNLPQDLQELQSMLLWPGGWHGPWCTLTCEATRCLSEEPGAGWHCEWSVRFGLQIPFHLPSL